MRSEATTVDQYLAELPDDRREAISALRKVILKNLPKGYEEGMEYGMIGYHVPHSIYPPGYHCNPKQPLPFAALASQKNHTKEITHRQNLEAGLTFHPDARHDDDKIEPIPARRTAAGARPRLLR